jgi:hypothetical protein
MLTCILRLVACFMKKLQPGGARGKNCKHVKAFALPPVLGLNHIRSNALPRAERCRIFKKINTSDFPEPGRDAGEPGLAGAGRDPVELHPGPGDGGQQPRAPALPVRSGHGTNCRLPSVLPQSNQGNFSHFGSLRNKINRCHIIRYIIAGISQESPESAQLIIDLELK